MMLPKEHGVYAQASCPLIVALAVAGPRRASVLLAVAIISVFFLHEPLLVVLGQRGRRIQRSKSGTARRWLIGLTSVALLTGGLALLATPALAPWLLLPAVPAIFVLASAWRGSEKNWPSQVGVALAFSFAVLPVGVAADVSAAALGVIAGVLATHFILGSLAVRAVVLRTREHRNPRVVRAARLAVFATATAGGVGALVLTAAGTVVPRAAVWALVLGIVPALYLACFPPPASHLRRVGWTLVGSAAAVTTLLIFGYRG